MNKLAQLDHRHVWHPFTQMRDWLRREPIVIVEGKGAVLRDTRGREYLDANFSASRLAGSFDRPRAELCAIFFNCRVRAALSFG